MFALESREEGLLQKRAELFGQAVVGFHCFSDRREIVQKFFQQGLLDHGVIDLGDGVEPLEDRGERVL